MAEPIRGGLSSANVRQGFTHAADEVVRLAAQQRHRRARDPGMQWYRTEDWSKFQPPPGLLSEFTQSYKHALGQGTFENLGAALEATGYMLGSETVSGYGASMSDWASNLGIGAPPSVGSLGDVEDLDSAMRFIMGGLGSGLGSTTPSIVGGVAGGLAGSAVAPGLGTVVGAGVGATLPAIPMNLGEAYSQFVEEGIERPVAATAAGWLTPALTALDTAGLFGAIRAASGPIKGAFVARVAKRVGAGLAAGALAEGGTEGLQSTLREAVAAELTDNPDLANRAMRILDETVIGALTGGAIGGAVGIGRSVREPQDQAPDVDSDIDDLGAVEGTVRGARREAGAQVAAESGPLAVRTIYGGAEGQPGVAVPGQARPSGPSARALPTLPLEGEVLPAEAGGLPATAEHAPGLELDPLEGHVLRKDMTPFRTDRSARMAARGRRLQGYRPVHVEGGWALAPPIEPTVTETGSAEPRGPRKTPIPVTETGRAAPRGPRKLEKPEKKQPPPLDVLSLKVTAKRIERPKTAAPVAPEEATLVPPEPATLQAPQEQAALVEPEKVDLIRDVAPPAARKLLRRAEKDVEPNPTEAQKAAGTYKKGHIKIGGLEVSIENAKGSTRSGTAPDGSTWSVKMPATYGDIKRTEGADGDAVDVYVGERLEAPTVWVVDQVDAETGKFDEHKAFLGFSSTEEVVKTYDAAFDDGKGPQRRRAILEVPFDSFKTWVREKYTKKAMGTHLGDVSGAVDRTPPAQAPKKDPKSVAPSVPSKPLGEPQGEPREVSTEAGRKVEVQPEIVELDELVTSHNEEGRVNPDYPSERQPRDRGRIASKTWIMEKSRKVDPALLDLLPMASHGAPIVSDEGFVESGNGRTLVLRRAYAQGTAGGYREWLGERFDVSKFDQPVLVQRRLTPMAEEDLEAFAREANKGDMLAMGASEAAGSDAASLTPELIAGFQGGHITAAQNRDFVRAYLRNVVPLAEQGAMVTAQGELAQPGIQRIENALFERAYEAPDLLGQLREDPDTNIKSIGSAMIEVAGRWSKLRDAAKAGRINKAMDTSPDLVEAARLVGKARREGRALSELVKQDDIFATEGVSPDTIGFLNLMFRNPAPKLTQPAGQARLVKGLNYYVDMAMATSAGADIFGFTATPTEVAETARKKVQEHEDAGRKQTGLFSRVPRRVGEGAGEAIAGGAEQAARGAATPGRPSHRELREADATTPDIHRVELARPSGGATPPTPLGATGVRAAVDPIIAQWKAQDAPAVQVVESAAELPENIRAQIDETPDLSPPDGVFDPNTDTIYLIGDQITSPDRAKRVLAHEAMGHHSLAKVAGEDFPKLLNEVLELARKGDRQVAPIVAQVREEYGDIGEDVVAAETLAKMAEQGVRNPIMSRLVAAVRRFLRSLGLRLAYSYAEVQDMIARAARRLHTRDPGFSVPEPEPTGWMASRRDPDTEKPLALRITHAIPEGELNTALERGHLVAPSVAVQPPGVPNEFGFERVVLVFKPDAIDFRADNVRSGDYWTPIHPTVSRLIRKDTERDALVAAATRDFNAAPESLRRGADQTEPIKDWGVRNMLFQDSDSRVFSSDLTTAERVLGTIYLAQKGRKRLRKDPYALRNALEAHREDYERWKDDYVASHAEVTEMLKAGWTNLGRTKWKEATGENILEAMRRAWREQESGGFLSTFRELVGKQRKRVTVRQAREETGKVRLAGELEEARFNEQETRFREALPTFSSTFTLEEVMQTFKEKGVGTPAAMRWLEQFGVEISESNLETMRDAVRQAEALPVPYLEGKPMRHVPLEAVARAVVGPRVAPATRQALEARGIEVVRVKNEASVPELAAAQNAPQAIFSRRSIPPDPLEESSARTAQRRGLELLAATAETPEAMRVMFSRGSRPPTKDTPRRKPIRPVDRIFRTMMFPLGGINKEGEWRYAPQVKRAATKVIWDAKPDPEGKFSFLDPVIETARHGWLNRYGTPREFIEREHLAQAEETRMLLEGVAFVEQMQAAELSREDSEALQRILEGEELNDAKLRGLAEPIRAALDEYGRQLVEIGVLPERAYMRNFGKWLHRSYRQYEEDATPLQKWARGRMKRRALQGDELKLRGKRHPVTMAKLLRDVPKEHRKRAMQAKAWEVLEKTNPDGRVVRRVYWPKGVPVPEEFAPITPDPNRNSLEGWRSLGEWELLKLRDKGKPVRTILRQDYTEAEREEMGEIRLAQYNVLKSFQLMAHDLASGRMFKDISDNPEWFSAERPADGSVVVDAGQKTRFYESIGFAGVDWVKVPDTAIPKSGAKRWGAMAGGYLQAEIWRDMLELNKMQSPGFWGDMMRQWKINKTARSPVVHFNNTVGNFFLLDMNDLTWTDFSSAIREWAAKGDLYQEATVQGIFNVGYVAQELQRERITPILKAALAEAEADATKSSSMERMLRVIGKLDQKFRDAYQFEDEIFRLASFMRDIDEGRPTSEAAERARDRFLNYDVRAPWPNFLRRTALPFFSYTYAFLPQLASVAVSRPWKIAKYFTIGYVMIAAAIELTDGDEERERAAFAERDLGYTWTGLPRMFRLPFTTSHGDPMYLDTARIMPGGGIMETDKGPSTLFGVGIPEWLMLGGPLAIAADLLWNRVAFSGEDIIDREIDTPVDQAVKQALYLWRAILPNAPWIPGSWSWKLLAQAASGERDLFGRSYSMTTALIRQMGPKVKPHDPEYQIMLRSMEMQRKMRKHRANMRKAGRDFARQRIDREQLEGRVEKSVKAIKKLAESHADRMRAFQGAGE